MLGLLGRPIEWPMPERFLFPKEINDEGKQVPLERPIDYVVNQGSAPVCVCVRQSIACVRTPLDPSCDEFQPAFRERSIGTPISLASHRAFSAVLAWIAINRKCRSMSVLKLPRIYMPCRCWHDTHVFFFFFAFVGRHWKVLQ